MQLLLDFWRDSTNISTSYSLKILTLTTPLVWLQHSTQLVFTHHHLRQDLAVADQVQVVSLAAAEAGEKFIHSLRKYTGYTLTLYITRPRNLSNR
ncbi:hypothetical protein HC864_03430 [Candidatus Gracilibacteria bacterium]|nr:hypothetical protein [Candidatus Gracilibacteria bacterium]